MFSDRENLSKYYVLVYFNKVYTPDFAFEIKMKKKTLLVVACQKT